MDKSYRIRVMSVTTKVRKKNKKKVCGIEILWQATWIDFVALLLLELTCQSYV